MLDDLDIEGRKALVKLHLFVDAVERKYVLLAAAYDREVVESVLNLDRPIEI